MVGKKIFQGGHYLLLGLFSLLILGSLIAAVRSSNLLLTMTTAKIFLVPLGIGLVLIGGYFFKKTAYRYQLLISLLFFVLAVLFQVSLVYATHPPVGFDVMHFYNYIHNHNPGENAYYSMYPNNLFSLIIFNAFFKLAGTAHYWLKADLLNTLMVDLALVINCVTVLSYQKKYLLKAVWTQILLMFIFPMIIIPYTDTLVMPFAAGMILCLAVINKTDKLTVKLGATLLLGFLTIVGYFIKPTAIILIIAFVLWTIFSLFNEFNFKKIIPVVILFLTMGGSYLVISHQVKHQTLLKIDQSRAFPAIHYVDMGMYGTGGFSAKLYQENHDAKTKQERIDISKANIKMTLKKRGFLGYLKFLMVKQGLNTADGTFGWLKEGQFILANSKDTYTLVSAQVKPNIFKEYLYPDGKYLHDFYFVAQLVWCLALLFLLLGYDKTDLFLDTLRLGVIGGMIFLLLFEGGRSRYLIQFLPTILVLLSITFESSLNRLRLVKAALMNRQDTTA